VTAIARVLVALPLQRRRQHYSKKWMKVACLATQPRWLWICVAAVARKVVGVERLASRSLRMSVGSVARVDLPRCIRVAVAPAQDVVKDEGLIMKNHQDTNGSM
jgi:hypothetical protein